MRKTEASDQTQAEWPRPVGIDIGVRTDEIDLSIEGGDCPLFQPGDAARPPGVEALFDCIISLRDLGRIA
jgi:hypothetical protein